MVSPRLEKMLRKSMEKLGGAVEFAIGRAQKAKGSVSAASTVKPIIALEGQLPIQKIKELTNLSVDRIITPQIANMVDKSALEVTDGPMRFAPLLKEKGASVSVNFDIGGSSGTYPKEMKNSNIHTIRGSIRSVPFEDGFFDFIVANLATPAQGDITRSVRELSRALTLGGRLILVDHHPFGLFAKKGSARLRSQESVVRGVEDYYKICEAAGLSVAYIKEAFIDETLRSQFETPEEKASFRSVKDSPFLIFLLTVKKGKNPPPL